MWTDEAHIDTTASSSTIWALFTDVDGWKDWNAGIESIALHGPFAVGTTFTMRPPGQAELTSTLVEVNPARGFTDETIVDGVIVRVHHYFEPLPGGKIRITYRTEASGAHAEEFGPLITADFPDVLMALKKLAESQSPQANT